MRKIILILNVMALTMLACRMSQCTFERETAKCELPPQPFQETDLVGTWVSKHGNNITDTLILKADGTYQQIYNNPIAGDYFESEWQKWWIEYGASGIPHLHLQGMRKCDSSDEDCLRERGGAPGAWLDFCENQPVYMQNKVVLLVTGVPSNHFNPPPRGIELWQLSMDPDTVGSHFWLEE